MTPYQTAVALDADAESRAAADLPDAGAQAARATVHRALVVSLHVGLWAASLLLAFGLRFDFLVSVDRSRAMFESLPLLIAFRVAVFGGTGLFRGLWKYSGARDLWAILGATSASSLLLLVSLGLLQPAFPRSVVAIEWALAILVVGGARLAYRTIEGTRPATARVGPRPDRVLLVGAGDAGEMLLREILRNQGSRIEVVGFADDDPEKRGGCIHGIPVLGSVEEIPRLVADRDVDEVLIAAPTATRAQTLRIVERCRASGAPFKTIPGIHQLIDGQATLHQLREVSVEDLLGREPVELDVDAISAATEGQVVMVTGAGGSIGSELCRQIAHLEPAALLLVERSENALFNVHRDLAARHPGLTVVPYLADVADAPRIEELFRQHHPRVVVHAAAHKHVPMMEWNPGEAVKNNVVGTRTLADLADRHGVERFVMVSTDKAVNPTSVMGASKRVAEIYVQSLSRRSRTRFVTVRFGNVLGSAGSVIPIFKEQIASGGPVTVTHPEMKRYFMTIPEACHLVLLAGTMGRGGEIFVLDMGQPVRIADLARDLIQLSGLTPGVDIEIRFTGIRPGEKLFEELSLDGETAENTRHPRIFVGRFRPYAEEEVERGLERLTTSVGLSPGEIRSRFTELVPEYRPSPGATAA